VYGDAMMMDETQIAFLESIQHDLQTPLSAIIGLAALIHRESREPTIQTYATQLMASAHALTDFQKMLLSQPANACDLKQTMDGVLALVRPKALLKNLILEVTYDEALPSIIQINQSALFRILLELINNAIKFTPSGFVRIFFSIKSHD
jgi:signal transduction histidine kinase